MNRNVKISVTALILLANVIVSCDKEDEGSPIENSAFTEVELAVLNQSLNLPSELVAFPKNQTV